MYNKPTIGLGTLPYSSVSQTCCDAIYLSHASQVSPLLYVRLPTPPTLASRWRSHPNTPPKTTQSTITFGSTKSHPARKRHGLTSSPVAILPPARCAVIGAVFICSSEHGHVCRGGQHAAGIRAEHAAPAPTKEGLSRIRGRGRGRGGAWFR